MSGPCIREHKEVLRFRPDNADTRRSTKFVHDSCTYSARTLFSFEDRRLGQRDAEG